MTYSVDELQRKGRGGKCCPLSHMWRNFSIKDGAVAHGNQSVGLFKGRG